MSSSLNRFRDKGFSSLKYCHKALAVGEAIGFSVSISYPARIFTMFGTPHVPETELVLCNCHLVYLVWTRTYKEWAFIALFTFYLFIKKIFF